MVVTTTSEALAVPYELVELGRMTPFFFTTLKCPSERLISRQHVLSHGPIVKDSTMEQFKIVLKTPTVKKSNYPCDYYSEVL